MDANGDNYVDQMEVQFWLFKALHKLDAKRIVNVMWSKLDHDAKTGKPKNLTKAELFRKPTTMRNYLETVVKHSSFSHHDEALFGSEHEGENVVTEETTDFNKFFTAFAARGLAAYNYWQVFGYIFFLIFS